MSHCLVALLVENQSNSDTGSYLQNEATTYLLGSESIGIVRSSTGMPNVDVKSFIRSSFSV